MQEIKVPQNFWKSLHLYYVLVKQKFQVKWYTKIKKIRILTKKRRNPQL